MPSWRCCSLVQHTRLFGGDRLALTAHPHSSLLRRGEGIGCRKFLRESGLGAAAAVLAVGGVRLALPQSLELGPRWLHLTIVIVLLVMTAMTYRRDREELNQLLGYVLASALTFFLVWSLVLLVLAVPAHKESAGTMLRSAVALWVSNVLVFAYWYWRLDDGGPSKRNARSDKLFTGVSVSADDARRSV